MNDIEKYVVVADNGVQLEGEGDVTHVKGETIELSASADQTKALLESGAIASMLSEEDLEDFTVTQEFLDANPGYVANVGDVVKMPKADLNKSADEKDGFASLDKTTEPAAEPAAQVEETAAVEPADENAEPRKRYRGRIVLNETMRTVGEQEFHHVKLEDGTEEDLTEAEYNSGVKMSYPADHALPVANQA